MTKHRDLKRLIRERMAKTGESYAAARRHVENASKPEAPPPPPAPDNDIQGWRRIGDWKDYEIGVDPSQGHRGPASAFIRAQSARAGTSTMQLLQAFLAEPYRGCRLRLSGWVKSDGLTGACRLWMGLDEHRRQLVRVESPRVTGTQTWTRLDVALDVVEDATLILIGLTLEGAGAAWLSDVELEHGGRTIPSDDTTLVPVQPRNLSFLE